MTQNSISNGVKRYVKILLQEYFLSDLKNSLATQRLSPLLNDGQYIPWTESSLSPSAICKVLNDIIINDRSTIVEFGSGISSLLIGLTISRNNISGCHLYTFEHDYEWSEKVTGIFEKNNVNSCISVTHAPLKPNMYSWNNEKWYDIDNVKNKLNGKSIDLLIVDGPPAHRPEIAHSRFPAVPVLKEMFSDRYSIFLDDISRESEKNIAETWSKNLNLSYSENILGKDIAVFMRGKSYTI